MGEVIQFSIRKQREREREQVNQDLYSQESVVEKRFKRNEMKNRNLAVAPGSPPWKRARQKERERERERGIAVYVFNSR